MPNYGIYSKIFPRDDAGIRRWSVGDTILSGKYQLCRVIGRGRTGTVYLGLHKELEEYRAIKAVAKSSVRYEAFRKEALLLKELRHPGIPIVYDIEASGPPHRTGVRDSNMRRGKLPAFCRDRTHITFGFAAKEPFGVP